MATEMLLFQMVWKKARRQNLINLIPEQHFTQPPARFTDATAGCDTGRARAIGRPSTYASILSTIQDRGYAYKDAKRLFPTETGILVNDLLVQYFEGHHQHRFFGWHGRRAGRDCQTVRKNG